MAHPTWSSWPESLRERSTVTGYPRRRPITSAARRERHWCFGDSSRWRRTTVTRPGVDGALRDGCGNTDSWVDAAPSLGWSAQYADAANSSFTPTAGATSLEALLDPLGEGRSRRRGRARLGQLPGGQRPDGGRLLADGVGERQQRAPALVHQAHPGRRIRRGVVRRLRQPLRRPARADPVVSGHPVDPLALPGHRNAIDAKASRQRSTAGGDPSRAGAGFRRPPRRRRRATRSTWSPTSTRRIRSGVWRTARRPGRSARSPRHPLSRRPPRRSSSPSGSPAHRTQRCRRCATNRARRRC